MLQPEIFDVLSSQERGAGNEIQLTDAMLKLEKRSRTSSAITIAASTYDCGSPEGFLEANLAFALARPDMRDTVLGLMEAMIRDKGKS